MAFISVDPFHTSVQPHMEVASTVCRYKVRGHWTTPLSAGKHMWRVRIRSILASWDIIRSDLTPIGTCEPAGNHIEPVLSLIHI